MPIPTLQEAATNLARGIERGLRQQITTKEVLKKYANEYERVYDHLTVSQRLYLETQFARHEYHLSQQPSLPNPPQQWRIGAYADAPTPVGERRRIRNANEMALMSTERINWDEY